MTTHVDASGPLDEHDESVLAELREIAARVDPVPASLSEKIKYAMTVRMLEAEVAQLTQMPAAMARSESGEHIDSVSFSGTSVSLMVTMSVDSEGVRVDCWATTGGALVEIRFNGSTGRSPDATGANARQEVCDEHGRCAFSGLPHGPAHFIVWEDEAKLTQPIITPTINL